MLRHPVHVHPLRSRVRDLRPGDPESTIRLYHSLVVRSMDHQVWLATPTHSTNSSNRGKSDRDEKVRRWPTLGPYMLTCRHQYMLYHSVPIGGYFSIASVAFKGLHDPTRPLGIWTLPASPPPCPVEQPGRRHDLPLLTNPGLGLALLNSWGPGHQSRGVADAADHAFRIARVPCMEVRTVSCNVSFLGPFRNDRHYAMGWGYPAH